MDCEGSEVLGCVHDPEGCVGLRAETAGDTRCEIRDVSLLWMVACYIETMELPTRGGM